MHKEKYYPGHPFIEKIIQDALNYNHIVIDSFSGFGGTTEGFRRTGKYKVIACINHWNKAISTHELNHEDCLHIEEDFRTADLSLIKYMVDKIRLLKPSIQVHGWFSLECTNFSNAKGGMPRDGDSRTLADHLPRHVKIFDFDVIWIENVKEFLIWGPMLPKEVNGVCPLVWSKKNKSFGPWMVPDANRKGEDFERWKELICGFGYECEHRLLNAADFGVPQHRVRLFIQFTRNIAAKWPAATHSKKSENGLPKWKAISTCLDLSDEGTDLLSFRMNKKGELVPRIKSPKTIERIMVGCTKHVLNGSDYFITKYMGNAADTGINNGKGIHEPSISIPTSNRQALVKARMIDYYFGNGYTKPITEPAGVSGTVDGSSVHTIKFISEFHSRGEAAPVSSASKPILTKDKYSLDTVQYLSQQNSGAASAKNFSVEKPSRTVTASGGKMNLITSKFIDQTYGQSLPISLDMPSGGITEIAKQNPISVDHIVMDTQFNNEAHAINENARTVTANRKHYYIVNFQWFGDNTRSLAQAASTVIASMDKEPTYLIVTEQGELAIEVFPHDPPHYVAMKRFMAANGIVSIKMRMLKESELLQIQDLPKTYKLTASSTDNKKMIGNAVPPALVVALANAYDDGWKRYRAEKVAA